MTGDAGARRYLSFWGTDDTEQIGGCCRLDHSGPEYTWGLPYELYFVLRGASVFVFHKIDTGQVVLSIAFWERTRTKIIRYVTYFLSPRSLFLRCSGFPATHIFRFFELNRIHYFEILAETKLFAHAVHIAYPTHTPHVLYVSKLHSTPRLSNTAPDGWLITTLLPLQQWSRPLR